MGLEVGRKRRVIVRGGEAWERAVRMEEPTVEVAPIRTIRVRGMVVCWEGRGDQSATLSESDQ